MPPPIRKLPRLQRRRRPWRPQPSSRPKKRLPMRANQPSPMPRPLIPCGKPPIHRRRTIRHSPQPANWPLPQGCSRLQRRAPRPPFLRGRCSAKLRLRRKCPRKRYGESEVADPTLVHAHRRRRRLVPELLWTCLRQFGSSLASSGSASHASQAGGGASGPPKSQPKPATVPLKDISLQVAQPGAQKVEVRVVQQSGELRVAVRTGDSDLAHGLQQGLSDLVGRLQENGFRAEAWRPGGPPCSPLPFSSPVPAPAARRTGIRNRIPAARISRKASGGRVSRSGPAGSRSWKTAWPGASNLKE